jgi:hypothetical protein
MTHTKRSLGVVPVWLFFAIALALAVPASAQWKEKVLYSFQGGTDGSLPAGGVIFDKAGNLYGVTIYGGSTACPPGWCGTIYELSPPAQKGGAWTEKVLYVFKGHDQNDGSSPTGTLIADSAGNLYGVTGYGGSGPCVLFGTATGCGTVYELSPPKQKGGAWTETVLYNFQGGKDGDLPSGTLVFDTAGNLYGVTLFGGGKGTSCDIFYGGTCGTVFKLSAPKQKGGKWTEKVLHSFSGIATGKQNGDGAVPNGGLVLDRTGMIYGTTYNGGYNCPHDSNQGCGTVFGLKRPTKKGESWTERLIHVFKDGADGTQPNTGVLLGTDDSLYGGAGGGAGSGGIIFRFAAATDGRWTETVLHTFNTVTYGYGPSVTLFDSCGDLCGTTFAFPDSHSGSVFCLKRPSETHKAWTLTYLYKFTGYPNGIGPTAYLTRDSMGYLYGTTEKGGTGKGCGSYGCGMAFELKP